PGFGEARILELNTQCRPTLPDHRPAISWDGAQALTVNGLYRHGYMIAPEVSKAAADLAVALLTGQVKDADSFGTLRAQSRWAAMLHGAGAHASVAPPLGA
ncbi:MAG: FAD-dependent oxidoreductase, partial [Trinickia sp.]